MSNVVEFYRKIEPDRFPKYRLDDQQHYEQTAQLYRRAGICLGLWHETGKGPSSTYLVLHDGQGNNAMCLRIWDPIEAHDLSTDEVVRQSLMVARGLDHNWSVLRAQHSVDEDAGHTDAL